MPAALKGRGLRALSSLSIGFRQERVLVDASEVRIDLHRVADRERHLPLRQSVLPLHA